MKTNVNNLLFACAVEDSEDVTAAEAVADCSSSSSATFIPVTKITYHQLNFDSL